MLLEPAGKATRKFGNLILLHPARTFNGERDEVLSWTVEYDVKRFVKLQNEIVEPVATPLLWITAEGLRSPSACILKSVSWVTLTCDRR